MVGAFFYVNLGFVKFFVDICTAKYKTEKFISSYRVTRG